MINRDRYQTSSYSHSRDRGRAEHAAQDMRDARAIVARFNTNTSR